MRYIDLITRFSTFLLHVYSLAQLSSFLTRLSSYEFAFQNSSNSSDIKYACVYYQKDTCCHSNLPLFLYLYSINVSKGLMYLI